MPFRAACRHAGVAVLIILSILNGTLPAHAQTRPLFIPEVTEIRRLLESATAWGAWRLVGQRLLTQAEADALPPLKIVVTIHDKRVS